MREVEDGALQPGGVKARLAESGRRPERGDADSAEREMHELTFTQKTPGVAEGFSKVRAAMDSAGPIPFGSLAMPFLRTPANLISMGMRYSPLAPFMRRYAEDIAEGGARAEMARAQWAIGTAFWSLWLGMAQDGKLTGNGPGNPARRRRR
jgi:hypothetical protein